jgi:hypothetical protein
MRKLFINTSFINSEIQFKVITVNFVIHKHTTSATMPQALPPVYENPKPVYVMDASGSLDQTLVERLLNQGYTVHAAFLKLVYSLWYRHRNMPL